MRNRVVLTAENRQILTSLGFIECHNGSAMSVTFNDVHIIIWENGTAHFSFVGISPVMGTVAHQMTSYWIPSIKCIAYVILGKALQARMDEVIKFQKKNDAYFRKNVMGLNV